MSRLTVLWQNSTRVHLVPRQLLTEDEATLLIIRHSSVTTPNSAILPQIFRRDRIGINFFAPNF